MVKPLLTIAIPTWNRSNYLSLNLSQLKKECLSVNEILIEILVSDNCSTDATASIVSVHIERGLPISYYCNEKNLGWGVNFLLCLKKARGKYVLLLGDDDLIVDGGLKKIINVLNSNISYGSISLNSYGYSKEFMQEIPLFSNQRNTIYQNFEEYLYNTCLINTLLSTTIINKDLIVLDETIPESEKNLTHLKYVFASSMRSEVNYFLADYIIAVKRDNSSSYRYTQVFVDELWNIYNNFFIKDDCSKRIVKKIKNRFLIYFYPRYILTINNYIFESQKEILENFDKHFFEITYYRYFFRKILTSSYLIRKILMISLTINGKVLSGDIGKLLNGILYAKLKVSSLEEKKKRSLVNGAILPSDSVKVPTSQPLNLSTSIAHYRICTNCIMDTTDPNIIFDERGWCNYCNNYHKNILPSWHPNEKRLKEFQPLIDKIKREGEGKSHDCLIGLSGGIDSSYVAYIAKEKLGLRPMLFHVDAGWNSQEAVNNIEKLVDGLELDLYTEVINWEEMKDLQLAFFKAQVPSVDTPQDHAFFAGLYNYAAQNGHKYILTGANYSTECVREPLEWHYHASDLSQLKDIHQKFGTRPLKSFPLADIFKYKLFYRFFKGVQIVKPLNYFPYSKEEAMNELVERFGWQKYPHKHYESRFTRFYEGYWLPEKFGYKKHRAHYSSLILTGQMTREEAMDKIMKPAYDESTIMQDLEYIAKKLDLSVDEFKELMKGKNKTYRDYKNNMFLISLGTQFMRWIGVQKSIIR